MIPADRNFCWSILERSGVNSRLPHRHSLEYHLFEGTRCSVDRRIGLCELHVSRLPSIHIIQPTVSRVCSICSRCPRRLRRMSAPTSSVSSAILWAFCNRCVPSSSRSVPARSLVREENADGSSVYGSSGFGNPGPDRRSLRWFSRRTSRWQSGLGPRKLRSDSPVTS